MDMDVRKYSDRYCQCLISGECGERMSISRGVSKLRAQLGPFWEHRSGDTHGPRILGYFDPGFAVTHTLSSPELTLRLAI